MKIGYLAECPAVSINHTIEKNMLRARKIKRNSNSRNNARFLEKRAVLLNLSHDIILSVMKLLRICILAAQFICACVICVCYMI